MVSVRFIKMWFFVFVSVFLSVGSIFGETHKRYKVRSGDNLTQISSKYGVPISQMIRANRLKSKNKIFTGQILKIPAIFSTRQKNRPSRNSFFTHPVDRPKLVKRFDLKGQYRTPGLLWLLKNDGYVRPSKPGRVVKIGFLREYGKYVMVDHGSGWISFYANLSKVFVRKNEKVSLYHKIAFSKNKKLFFSISRRGKPVNPIPLLKRNSRRLETS